MKSRLLPELLVLFAAYFATAKLGLMLDAVGGFATLVWPPSGIALAALYMLGPRLWPGVALGALAVNLSAGAPWPVAAAIAAGNTCEAVLGARLLRHKKDFRPDLGRLQDVLWFLGTVPLSALVSSTLGAASLGAGGVLPWTEYGRIWTAWWVGDILGVLLVSPLMFTWSGSFRPSASSGGWLENCGLAAALVFSGFAAFGAFPQASGRGSPLVYLVFLPLIWAALRRGQRGTTLCAAGLSALAVWGTSQGHGPFLGASLNERLMFLQLFMGVVTSSSLILASVFQEKEEARREARRSQDRLLDSLREKETLLKEIHHRVKNNLQIIYSLVNLQSQRVQDPETLNGLRDCRERVKTMALIHEKLYRSADLRRIYFAEYIEEMARGLFQAYGGRAGAPALRVQADGIFLSVDEAVPCGLMVYELVSNCLKYAFPGARAGSITVGLAREGDRLRLRVADDGVGFPSGLDFRNTQTLGLQLVVNLAQQLSGAIEKQNGRGTSFSVTFPAPKDLIKEVIL